MRATTRGELRAPAPIHRSQTQIRFHERDVLVTNCGRICMYGKKINIFTVMAGQRLDIEEVDDGVWLVSFMRYDLGYIDLEQRTLQPSTTRSARGCHPCLWDVLLPMSPVCTGRFPERCGGLGYPTIKSPLLAQATPCSLVVSPTGR